MVTVAEIITLIKASLIIIAVIEKRVTLAAVKPR